VAGTVTSMAPELLLQLLGTDTTEAEEGAAAAASGAAADVWALGCLACELLSGGIPPYGSDDDGAVPVSVYARRVLSCAPTLPCGLIESHPDAAAFISACLSKDPSARPSARAVLQLEWLAGTDWAALRQGQLRSPLALPLPLPDALARALRAAGVYEGLCVCPMSTAPCTAPSPSPESPGTATTSECKCGATLCVEREVPATAGGQ
jgi:serine/threonine protein kinase